MEKSKLKYEFVGDIETYIFEREREIENEGLQRENNNRERAAEMSTRE